MQLMPAIGPIHRTLLKSVSKAAGNFHCSSSPRFSISLSLVPAVSCYVSYYGDSWMDFFSAMTNEVLLPFSGDDCSTLGYVILLHVKQWLHVKWNTEIVAKLVQYLISYVTTSETEMKLFQPLKLSHSYFGDIEYVGKYSWAAIRFWIWNNFQIISSKFLRAEIKLF